MPTVTRDSTDISSETSDSLEKMRALRSSRIASAMSFLKVSVASGWEPLTLELTLKIRVVVPNSLLTIPLLTPTEPRRVYWMRLRVFVTAVSLRTTISVSSNDTHVFIHIRAEYAIIARRISVTTANANVALVSFDMLTNSMTRNTRIGTVHWMTTDGWLRYLSILAPSTSGYR